MKTARSLERETICVVAPVPPPYGGMSLQAEELVSRLAAEGLSVKVVPTNPLPPHSLRWIQDIPALRTLVREAQYLIHIIKMLPETTVCHVFSASGLYFFLTTAPALCLGRFFNKRIILNYRGGKAADFLKRWGWLALPMMRLANEICVPSEFLQQVFADHGLNAVVLPNIARTDIFPWKDRSHFAPLLLSTRNLEPMYNTECLLCAFRIVQASFPEASLSIAGEGSAADRLRKLAAEWNLRGVRFLGSIAHDELPAVYEAHDIYVNSSSVDNFPGALVEAACAGLPIVSTGAGGIPWMIRNRKTGIIVDLNDERAIAAGVLELVQHPEFGRKMARHARSWAEQFSWDHVFPKLCSAYGIAIRPSRQRIETEDADLVSVTP